MATKKVVENEVVELKPVEMVTTMIRIVGDTSLITHKWSEKAKRQMLEKQMKQKTAGHTAKNPVEDFIEATYWLTGKPEEYTEEAFEKAVENGATFGFDSNAVKQAAISAAYRDGVIPNKACAQGAFFIFNEDGGEMAQIKGDAPEMREDMVRVMVSTDIRYRPEFRHWYMDLMLKYDRNGKFGLQQIVNFINKGGISCGLGEWRVEKGGTHGMFHVEST